MARRRASRKRRITLYLFCLAGNTLLTATVGVGVIFGSNIQPRRLISPSRLSIGMGIRRLCGWPWRFTRLLGRLAAASPFPLQITRPSRRAGYSGQQRCR